MKIFAYSLRPYDEQGFFEDICKRLNIEYGFTSEYPSLENAHLAEGYDALSIITNTMDPALLDTFRALGIRYISTRTIGYDHIDNAYAHSIGIRTASISYDPTGVADYSIIMISGRMRQRHAMRSIRILRPYTGPAISYRFMCRDLKRTIT